MTPLATTRPPYPLREKPFGERRRISHLVTSGLRIEDPDDRADAERVYGWHCTLLTAPIARGTLAVQWIMVGFGLVGVGLSLTTGRWGMGVFFLVLVVLELVVVLGRRWQEGRIWTRLKRTALANGWVSPAEVG